MFKLMFSLKTDISFQKRILCSRIGENVLLGSVGPFRIIICFTLVMGLDTGFWGKEKNCKINLAAWRSRFLYQLMSSARSGHIWTQVSAIIGDLNMIIKRMLLCIWRIYGLLDIGQSHWLGGSRLQELLLEKPAAWYLKTIEQTDYCGLYVITNISAKGEEAKSVAGNEASTHSCCWRREAEPPVNLWSGPPRILG